MMSYQDQDQKFRWMSLSTEVDKVDINCDGLCHRSNYRVGWYPAGWWALRSKVRTFRYLCNKGRLQTFDSCIVCNEEFLDSVCSYWVQKGRSIEFGAEIDENLANHWRDEEGFWVEQRQNRIRFQLSVWSRRKSNKHQFYQIWSLFVWQNCEE